MCPRQIPHVGILAGDDDSYRRLAVFSNYNAVRSTFDFFPQHYHGCWNPPVVLGHRTRMFIWSLGPLRIPAVMVLGWEVLPEPLDLSVPGSGSMTERDIETGNLGHVGHPFVAWGLKWAMVRSPSKKSVCVYICRHRERERERVPVKDALGLFEQC